MSDRLEQMIEAELEEFGPVRYQHAHRIAQAMRRAYGLGASEQALGIRTVAEAANEAGVGRRRAYQLLAWLEERGLYTPIRVGSTVLVDRAFVGMLRDRRRGVE